MRMKRFVSVLAAAVMVFGVTGCNAITIDGETENVSGEAAGNGSIGFSVSTLNNPFFVTLSEGAKEKFIWIGVRDGGTPESRIRDITAADVFI